MKLRTIVTFLFVVSIIGGATWLVARQDQGSNRYVLQVAACFPDDIAVMNAFDRPDRIYRTFAQLEDGLLVELAEDFAEEDELFEVVLHSAEEVRDAGVDPRSPSGWALRFEDGETVLMACMGASGREPLDSLAELVEERAPGTEIDEIEVDGLEVMRIGDTFAAEHDGRIVLTMPVDGASDELATNALEDMIETTRRTSFASTPGLRRSIRFGEGTFSTIVATYDGLSEAPIWTGDRDILEGEFEIGAVGFSVSDRGFHALSRAVFAPGAEIPEIYSRSRPMDALEELPDIEDISVLYHVAFDVERMLRFTTGITPEEDLEEMEVMFDEFEETFGLSVEDDVLAGFTGEYGAAAALSPGGGQLFFAGVRDEELVTSLIDAIVDHEPEQPAGDSMADLYNMSMIDMLLPIIAREELDGHDVWRLDTGENDPDYILSISGDYLWIGDETTITAILNGDSDRLRNNDDFAAAYRWMRERSTGAAYIELGEVLANLLRIFSRDEDALTRLEEGIGGLFLSARRRRNVVEGELIIEWDLRRLLEDADEFDTSSIFEPRLPPSMPTVVE